jgi:predicted Rossmann-fold nucleotide-binding protein
VCGGTASGLMRVVSGVALAHGGRVIAVEPWAMHSAGGEREKGRGGCPYEVVEQAMTAHRDRVRAFCSCVQQ